MASIFYNDFWGELMNKNIDLEADTINCELHTSSYTPDKDHADAAVDNEHAASGNYSAGGIALASKAVSVDDANDWGKFDANDVVWEGSTITAQFAYLVDTTPATDCPILTVDFGSNVSSSSGNFTIQWHANGIFTLAQA